jgi:hypothetical protein
MTVSDLQEDDFITVFVLELGGTNCTLTLEEMKNVLDVMFDDEDDSEYTIFTKRMSRKEFLELPEFVGF